MKFHNLIIAGLVLVTPALSQADHHRDGDDRKDHPKGEHHGPRPPHHQQRPGGHGDHKGPGGPGHAKPHKPDTSRLETEVLAEELERRLHLMREAIRSVNAAGFPEAARPLIEIAAQIERELRHAEHRLEQFEGDPRRGIDMARRMRERMEEMHRHHREGGHCGKPG